MTDELKQWEYDKGYAKGYSDGRASFIEELEKIKAEISKLTRYYTTESGNINLVSDNAVYRIINKHISELKGEKNGICNDRSV